MKIRRGAADLLATHARRQKRPVTVTIQVTNRCNYDCTHCYQDGQAKYDELTLPEIERVLDQLANAGVLFLTLMGGEFFMRPDADHILSAAHQRGFAIKLLTTGHHITARRADFLASLRPIQVDMSLYSGHSHTHESITRSPGSWDRTVAAARLLVERKIPVLLKAPVMEANVADVPSLATLADQIGAKWSFDPKITAVENGDQASTDLRMKEETLRAFYRGPMREYLGTVYAPGTLPPLKPFGLSITPPAAPASNRSPSPLPATFGPVTRFPFPAATSANRTLRRSGPVRRI